MASRDCRLTRGRRIQYRRDFDRAYRRGRRAGGRTMVVHVYRRSAEEAGAGETRLGLSVPRRLGNAPLRNRAKRLLREAFRMHRESLPPGCDIVVVPRGDWDGMELATVVGELRRLVAKASGEETGGKRRT